jgi:hypothetical protein
MSGGQDPPNSRDELENSSSATSTSTDFREPPSQPSETLMTSLLAPLRPSETMRPEMFRNEPHQSSFDESDFDSLKSDPTEKYSVPEM